MGVMRPRTASYVRSSESYTHMGTLPRLLRRKDRKSKGEAEDVKQNDSSEKQDSEHDSEKCISYFSRRPRRR